MGHYDLRVGFVDERHISLPIFLSQRVITALLSFDIVDPFCFLRLIFDVQVGGPNENLRHNAHSNRR